MSKVLHHKVVAALPAPLEADSVYYVRKGSGFDMYVTNGAGIVTAYELNSSAGIAAIIRPVPESPLSGELVGATPLLKASIYSPLYSADSREYRRFEVTLGNDVAFSAPVFTIELDSDDAVVEVLLNEASTYIWRCRDVSLAGKQSEWSEVQTIDTYNVFENYIPRPIPTPAIGEPLEGGFYMGMFWGMVGRSSDSKALEVGTQKFFIPEMAAEAIVYSGQLLEIRSIAAPSNRFIGTVTGASGALLTVDVTAVEGFGTFDDWAIMSRFRNVVAPKASGGHPNIVLLNTTAPLPLATRTLVDGLSATNAMFAAGNAVAYPAAHWARSLNIGGYTDWHIPARDVLELCWRHSKPSPDANYTAENRLSSAFNYQNNGSFGAPSAVHGVNLNSYPQAAAYTPTNPAVSESAKYLAGGQEAFIYGDATYWSSTAIDDGRVWEQHWTTAQPGRQHRKQGSISGIAGPLRAVRRSII